MAGLGGKPVKISPDTLRMLLRKVKKCHRREEMCIRNEVGEDIKGQQCMKHLHVTWLLSVSG